MKLFFLGDIMPGGVLPYQDCYIDKEVLSFMQEFDLRIGTLECGVGTNIPFDEAKMANTMGIVYARDEDLLRLKDMNINVVSLANNHAFDLGLAGLENAMRLLDDMGIKYCGAGHNIDEARRPAVVEIEGKRIAFLGCMIDVPIPVIYHKATEREFGVYQVGIEQLEKDISELKKRFDYVIVMPHWGEEHSYYPPVYCIECAKRMIDASADAVIGSHTHIINPVTKYKGKYIYYSLGNFLFPDKCMQVPRPMFYPETKEEFLSLKRVWTYPYRIKEPVVAVWHGKNRIGMTVEMHLGENERITSNYRLTQLTSDNVLKTYSNFAYKIRILLNGLFLRLPFYKSIRKLLNSRYNIFDRILEQCDAFNVPVTAEEYK